MSAGNLKEGGDSEHLGVDGKINVKEGFNKPGFQAVQWIGLSHDRAMRRAVGTGTMQLPVGFHTTKGVS
jgi:hypothetical protein